MRNSKLEQGRPRGARRTIFSTGGRSGAAKCFKAPGSGRDRAGPDDGQFTAVGEIIGKGVMPRALSLRSDYSASDLRRLAARTKDGAQATRLLALAAVAEGLSRNEAARIGGMKPQTLRLWVQRFNNFGPEGLHNRKSTGRPPKLTLQQKKELGAIVAAGPDVKTDGVSRWRRGRPVPPARQKQKTAKRQKQKAAKSGQDQTVAEIGSDRRSVDAPFFVDNQQLSQWAG
jgi:transposase